MTTYGMSKLFFERAQRMAFSIEYSLDLEKLVQEMLDVSGGMNCDSRIRRMSDQEFIEFVKTVMRRSRRRPTEQVQSYA